MSTVDLKHYKDQVNYFTRNNILLLNEIKKLQQFDELDEDEIRHQEEKQAAKLVKYAAANSAFYKNLYAPVNLSGQFSDFFHLLPPITRADITGNPKQIATLWLRFLKEANTSGTSGTPLTVYRSMKSIIKENAYVWHFRMKHGLKMGDPIVSLRGLLKGETLYYYNKAENILYLSSYRLSKANIKTYTKLLEEFKPKALTAYPSTAYTLVNLMREEGIGTHIPKIYTSSESLYPFQREEIERVFEGKVFDSYGNVERTIHIGQCQYGTYHEYPMYSVNEYTDKGIYTTSLINKSFPLIRYFVDDMLTHIDSPCQCGKKRGIKSIDGRYDDVLILDDGTRITALSLAFYSIKNLKYSQIIQNEPGKIILNIVTEPGFNESDQKQLLSQLRLRLNNTVEIELNRISEEEIIRSKSGKYQLIVSRVKKNGQNAENTPSGSTGPAKIC